MSLKEYAEEIAKRLEELRPELKYTVNEHVKKNNGMELTGITIAEPDNNIAPIIYINHFYNDDVDVEDVVERILNIYDNQKQPSTDIDINDFTTFDAVKDRIVAKVVNKKKNEFMLNDVPYAQFGDMIVIFNVIVKVDDGGIASVRVTNSIMNTWKVNLAQLIELAYQNTKRIFPIEICPMHQLVLEMMRHGNFSEEQIAEFEAQGDADTNMFVISNIRKQNGAYFLTDREALVDISQEIKAEEFYILPSSIHELIVIPKTGEMMKEEELVAMVTEVNATQVMEDEVLADNVYFFDAKSEELRSVDGAVIPFIA